jgi:TonB family protein
VIHPSYFYLVILAVGAFAVPAGIGAQSPEPRTAAQQNAPKPKITYPDTQNGLKLLAGDILQAQKENNGPRAQELLDSFVLPNFREWYAKNFNEYAVVRAVPAYAVSGTQLPAQLASLFLSSYQEGFRNIEAVRFEDEQSACSSEPVFGAMTARISRVPLYELRFTHGDRYKRVFAFAHVDGTFRLILLADLSKPAVSSNSQAASLPAKLPSPEERVTKRASVQAARLVCRVQPYYPEEARRQRISGTVRFHAVIGKDGSIKQLEALTGPSQLVTAAQWAVSQWRYHPTLVNGEPVEVDTTIDVIYSLSG